MRTTGVLSLLSGLTLSLLGTATAQDTATTSTTNYPQSVQISYQHLQPPNARTTALATVQYDPATLNYKLSSWTPPIVDNFKSESKSSPLVRILTPDGSSTIASLDSFAPNLSQQINLWISQDAEVNAVSASLTSINPEPISKEEELLRQKEERLRARGKPVPPRPTPKTKKARAEAEARAKAGPQVSVNLNLVSSGPTPKLNTRKAPEVDAEGREIVAEEQVEKTFLQKYWYFLLIGAFLLMSGGGGKE